MYICFKKNPMLVGIREMAKWIHGKTGESCADIMEKIRGGHTVFYGEEKSIMVHSGYVRNRKVYWAEESN